MLHYVSVGRGKMGAVPNGTVPKKSASTKIKEAYSRCCNAPTTLGRVRHRYGQYSRALDGALGPLVCRGRPKAMIAQSLAERGLPSSAKGSGCSDMCGPCAGRGKGGLHRRTNSLLGYNGEPTHFYSDMWCAPTAPRHPRGLISVVYIWKYALLNLDCQTLRHANTYQTGCDVMLSSDRRVEAKPNRNCRDPRLEASRAPLRWQQGSNERRIRPRMPPSMET